MDSSEALVKGYDFCLTFDLLVTYTIDPLIVSIYLTKPYIMSIIFRIEIKNRQGVAGNWCKLPPGKNKEDVTEITTVILAG